MKRHGMTILELLFALALLGILCLLLSSWLVTVSRLSATQGPRLEWRSAATRLLDGIADDLTCGDFEMADRRSKVSPRVEVLEPIRLRIRTRSTSTWSPDYLGPAIHEFRFDRSGEVLSITAASLSRPTSAVERDLLRNVADWRIELDEPRRELRVSIVSRQGDTLSRRFTWPWSP